MCRRKRHMEIVCNKCYVSKKICGIDFETHPISVDAPAPKPVCLSYYIDNTRQTGLLTTHSEMSDFLNDLLKAEDQLIIAHNFKFESTVIHEHFPELREALWKAYEDERLVCTMVDEKIINNFANKNTQHRFDLGTLVKKYLELDITAGKEDPDAWRTRYNELDGVPLEEWPQDAIDYAINDSIYAVKIHKLQDKFETPLSYRSTRADFVLALAANRGMAVESGRVLQLKQEILDKLEPNYQFLEDRGFGTRCGVTGKFKKSVKVFKEYIVENVEHVDTTAKGSIKVTAEALSKYIPKTDADSDIKEVIKAFLTLAEYEKILSAFVPNLEKAAEEGGLIRTNYNPVVSTGRTSSSASRLYPSANIQQMPRALKGVKYDVRSCYKARDGYKLVSIDYGGLELCATAHQLFEVYGHSRMRDLLNEGDYPMDLHSRFAAQVMSLEMGHKIEYKTFLDKKKEPEYARYRQICKALNLGFPGGIGYEVMGGQLFKQGVDIPKTTLKDEDGKPIVAVSEKQAVFILGKARKVNPDLRVKRIGKRAWIFIKDELVGLKQRYFEMYPEIETFLKETHNYFLTGDHKMQKNDFAEWEKEPLYKFNVCGLRRNYAMYTQFCNGFLMQSPSAEGAKQMLWEIGERFRNSNEVHLDAFIHDEIVVEVKNNENFEKNVDLVSRIMIESMQKVLPSVRINVEASAMTYWSKDTPPGEFEALYWMDPGNKELKCEKN